MTESKWRSLTEPQRIKLNLWSRLDRLSVPLALWGHGDFTIKIKHTFGEKLTPKPSTLDNVHCHRVVNRAGRAISVAQALKMEPLPDRN